MPLRPAKTEGPIYRTPPLPPPSVFEAPSTRPRAKITLGLAPGQTVSGGPLMVSAARVAVFVVVASGGYAPPPGLNVETGAQVLRANAGDLVELSRSEAASAIRTRLLDPAVYATPKVWAGVDPVNDVPLLAFDQVEGTERFVLLRDADLNVPLEVGSVVAAAPYDVPHPAPNR